MVLPQSNDKQSEFNPGTLRVEGDNQLLQVVHDLHTGATKYTPIYAKNKYIINVTKCKIELSKAKKGRHDNNVSKKEYP